MAAQETVDEEIIAKLKKYCEKYHIPIEYIVKIISDQKVLPMIRGKTVEYSVFDLLKNMLDPNIWTVEKRDLNAQPNQPDQDVVVIHKETGNEIIVECKSAVRDSFKLSTRNNNFPHYKVKCHKSRSYIGRETNDRYLVGDFDIVVSSPSNSLIKGGKEYDVTDKTDVIQYLKNHYEVDGQENIFKSSNEDWRCALSTGIANEEGVINRTPTVRYENDPNWNSIEQIEEALIQILQSRGVSIS